MINRQWLLQLKQALLAVKIYKMLLIMSLLHFIYNINICSLLLLLMPQRKIWTQEQDRILKLLKEQRGQKKWSTIAKAMQRDFGLFGRTGKQCRERYHNHLDSSIVSAEWTRSQEDILYEQHEQVGNKWSIIAQNLPGRSDNCVKNHFYSKLRKAVRKLNKIIFQRFANYYHQFNISLLYKIIQTSQQKFKINSKINEDIIADCNNIKNQLYRFDSLGKQNQKREYKIKRLIQNIAQYEARLKKNTKTYKKHKVSIETNASQSEIPQENEREQGSNIVKREDQEVSYYKIIKKICEEIVISKNQS